MKNFIYSLIACSLLSTASAAIISWTGSTAGTSGSVGQNLTTGLFDTSGTLVFAENSGGSAVTFDGILFSNAAISFGNTFAGFHDGAASPLSANGTWSGSPSTVTLTGLTPGASYRVQVLLFDGRPPFLGRTVTFDSTNLGSYANGAVSGVSWGTGLLATGTFTADASTQAYTTNTFNAGGSSSGGQMNAIALYQTAIPEPSVTLLGVLAAVGFTRRRRC